MEVHLDAEAGRSDRRSERKSATTRRVVWRHRHPVVAEQTGRVLAEREHEWLKRLTTDPASFASVERRGSRASPTAGRSLRRRIAGQGQ